MASGSVAVVSADVAAEDALVVAAVVFDMPAVELAA